MNTERRIWTAHCLEDDCHWGFEDTDYAALLTAVTKHEHRYSIEIHYRGWIQDADLRTILAAVGSTKETIEKL